MENVIARSKTPEEQELEKKLAELSALEVELTERELELATFQGQLNAFEREYLRVVGIRYARLDEIEAEIAKYLAFLNPNNSTVRKQAEEAWAKAQDTKRAASEDVTNSESSGNFKPWESLRKLYREVAKRIHPDLTTDKTERLRRQQLMAEANQAYENGDEDRLRAILDAWENSPNLVQGQGVGAELIRTIRKIAQVKERLKAIEGEIEALKRSTLYQLREKFIAAQQADRDLLAEIAHQIDEQIAAAKVRLEELRAKVGF